MTCPLCLNPGARVFFCADPGKEIRCGIYRECPCCGLIFLMPEFHLSKEEEKKRYDFHQNRPSDDGYVKFLRRLVDPLAGRLPPGLSGLDYGCGPSPVLAGLLESRGFKMQSFDPFYFPQRPVRENCFDFVTICEVAEHFRAPRREFDFLQSIISPEGGCLAIMTRIYDDRIDFGSWWYRKDPTHIVFYRRNTMEWIAGWLRLRLESAGPDVFFMMRMQGA